MVIILYWPIFQNLMFIMITWDYLRKVLFHSIYFYLKRQKNKQYVLDSTKVVEIKIQLLRHFKKDIVYGHCLEIRLGNNHSLFL